MADRDQRADEVHSAILVEDDERTRSRLARDISSNPRLELVATAGSVADGMRALVQHEPHVLITDLGLPDGTGIALIGAARRPPRDCRIMVITVFGDEKNVLGAMQAGADSYLLKDATDREISSAIDELLDGGSPMSAPIARHLLERFRADRDTEARTNPDRAGVGLSAREFEVLNLVAKGFTFREIADLLKVSPHTIRTHVRRIYGKLEVSSKSAAVYEAVHLGLIDLS